MVVGHAADLRGAPDGDVQRSAGLADPAFGFAPVATLLPREALDFGLGLFGVFTPLDGVLRMGRGAPESGDGRLGVLLRARGLLACEHLLRFLERALGGPHGVVVRRHLLFGLLHASVHLLRVIDALQSETLLLGSGQLGRVRHVDEVRRLVPRGVERLVGGDHLREEALGFGHERLDAVREASRGDVLRVRERRLRFGQDRFGLRGMLLRLLVGVFAGDFGVCPLPLADTALDRGLGRSHLDHPAFGRLEGAVGFVDREADGLGLAGRDSSVLEDLLGLGREGVEPGVTILEEGHEFGFSLHRGFQVRGRLVGVVHHGVGRDGDVGRDAEDLRSDLDHVVEERARLHHRLAERCDPGHVRERVVLTQGVELLVERLRLAAERVTAEPDLGNVGFASLRLELVQVGHRDVLLGVAGACLVGGAQPLPVLERCREAVGEILLDGRRNDRDQLGLRCEQSLLLDDLGVEVERVGHHVDGLGERVGIAEPPLLTEHLDLVESNLECLQQVRDVVDLRGRCLVELESLARRGPEGTELGALFTFEGAVANEPVLDLLAPRGEVCCQLGLELLELLALLLREDVHADHEGDEQADEERLPEEVEGLLALTSFDEGGELVVLMQEVPARFLEGVDGRSAFGGDHLGSFEGDGLGGDVPRPLRTIGVAELDAAQDLLRELRVRIGNALGCLAGAVLRGTLRSDLGPSLRLHSSSLDPRGIGLVEDVGVDVLHGLEDPVHGVLGRVAHVVPEGLPVGSDLFGAKVERRG